MSIKKFYQYKLIDRPKTFTVKVFVSEYLFHLLFICFCFICLALYIVHISRSSLSPDERSIEKRLADCLTSAGVVSKNIIQRSNETSYTEVNWQWNTVNGYLEPMVYLVAEDETDVRNAVICCQLLKVRLVPRSGGHHFLKYGFGDSNSLVIDLTKLNKISIDPIQMSCEIGPGAKVAYVTYTLWKQGEFMITSGICPTVGIGGLALGGGYGYFTRLLGLATDNILQLEMVDAKGKLLVINNSTNEDLFWALRGGGGSFGIVTNIKFKMYSVPLFVVYGIYEYNTYDFSNFFEAWQNLITSNLPHNIGILMFWDNIKIEMRIAKSYFGSNESVIADLGDLLDSFSFPQPISSSIKTMSYYDFALTINQEYSSTPMHDLSEIANISIHARQGTYIFKSMYVDTILDKGKILKLQNLLRPYLRVAKCIIELNMGATNNFNSSETAFVHRGKNLYNIQLEVAYHDWNPNLKGISEMNKFYEATKTIWNHRESYQNYASEDIPDYLERYYGTNLKKLIEVKKRIDPENVFHHPQSIPVSLD